MIAPGSPEIDLGVRGPRTSHRTPTGKTPDDRRSHARRPKSLGRLELRCDTRRAVRPGHGAPYRRPRLGGPPTLPYAASGPDRPTYGLDRLRREANAHRPRRGRRGRRASWPTRSRSGARRLGFPAVCRVSRGIALGGPCPRAHRPAYPRESPPYCRIRRPWTSRGERPYARRAVMSLPVLWGFHG